MSGKIVTILQSIVSDILQQVAIEAGSVAAGVFVLVIALILSQSQSLQPERE